MELLQQYREPIALLLLASLIFTVYTGKLNLWKRVIIGLFMGVGVGLLYKTHAGAVTPHNYLFTQASDFKVLGTIFINLIKMVMVPLIFFALVSGVTGIGKDGNIKRMGLKAAGVYLSTAMFAVVIGLGWATLLKPGVGLDMSSFQASVSGTSSNAVGQALQTTPPSVGDTLMAVIPHNAIGAMAEGNILQVVVFAIFTGVMLNAAREKCGEIIRLSQEAAQLTFKMIETVVKIAPLGVYGFIAATVGTQGTEVLLSLGEFIVTFLGACATQLAVFGALIAMTRLNPFKFFQKIIPTQIMAFSTSSSKATLTTAMKEVQTKMGVSEKSANFVLPLGASINMDGTAIYLGICALFFAQAYGIELHTHQYALIILTSTLASIGAAGIPSGSLIFMGMVLSSVGLPIEGIALIAGIDRILDMIRTTVNITGDCAVTVAIDSSEGGLNRTVYNAAVAPQLEEGLSSSPKYVAPKAAKKKAA